MASRMGENAFLRKLEKFLLDRKERTKTASGRTELPDQQQEALRRAIKLQWITLAVLACVRHPGLSTMGNSQAMKAAWIEDMLSFAPPIAFLAGDEDHQPAAHPEVPVRLPPVNRHRASCCCGGSWTHGVFLVQSIPA